MNEENADRPMLDGNQKRALLDGVAPVQWDPQVEADYEASVEEIDRQISLLSERIFFERHEGKPDRGRIESLLQERGKLSESRAGLRAGHAGRLAAGVRFGEGSGVLGVLVTPDNGTTPA